MQNKHKKREEKKKNLTLISLWLKFKKRKKYNKFKQYVN
jgi:hypothetical protein